MTAESSARSNRFTLTVAAILIAGVLIAASILASSTGHVTITKTISQTTTEISVETPPTTATNSSQVSTTSNAGVVTQLMASTVVNHQVSDQFGGSGVSFGLYQTIPVTVYASSPITTSLTAVNVPSDAWV